MNTELIIQIWVVQMTLSPIVCYSPLGLKDAFRPVLEDGAGLSVKYNSSLYIWS